MEDRIDIRLTDYRHIAGCLDRIVSIEMLEAGFATGAAGDLQIVLMRATGR